MEIHLVATLSFIVSRTRDMIKIDLFAITLKKSRWFVYLGAGDENTTLPQAKKYQLLIHSDIIVR